MRLTAVDVSNVINVSEKLISNIYESCDKKETVVYCEDSATALVSSCGTVKENNVEDDAALAFCRRVEILTEYMRLLRNACADCISNQSVIQL